jgi:hypothetical protein
MTDGSDHKVLTIVTTLELDAEHKKYKPEHVSRLESAARDYLAENAGAAAGFLLMNKPKV